MARTPGIRVAPKHIPKVKQALKPQGYFRQQDLADDLELGRATIQSFLNGRRISHINFFEISKRLALDWKAIADKDDLPIETESLSKSPEDKPKPDNSSQLSSEANDRGVDYYIANQLPQALSEFCDALKHNPNFAEAHYNLGVLYEDLRNFDQARCEYQLAMVGGLAAAWNNCGRLEILAGNYEAAVELLRRGQQLAEHDAERYALWKNLGWAYLKQERYGEAEACLLDAIDLAREQASAYGLLAQVWESQGKQIKARRAWENFLCYASSHNPDEDAWIGLAKQRLAAEDKAK